MNDHKRPLVEEGSDVFSKRSKLTNHSFTARRFEWDDLLQMQDETITEYCERVFDLFSASGGHDRVMPDDHLTYAEQKYLEHVLRRFVEGFRNEDFKVCIKGIVDQVGLNSLSLGTTCATAIEVWQTEYGISRTRASELKYTELNAKAVTSCTPIGNRAVDLQALLRDNSQAVDFGAATKAKLPAAPVSTWGAAISGDGRTPANTMRRPEIELSFEHHLPHDLAMGAETLLAPPGKTPLALVQHARGTQDDDVSIPSQFGDACDFMPLTCSDETQPELPSHVLQASADKDRKTPEDNEGDSVRWPSQGQL